MLRFPLVPKKDATQCPDNAKLSCEAIGSIAVSAEDLQRAEQGIIKAIQHEAFRKEVDLLTSTQNRHESKDRARKGMTRSSSIHRLDPFLDEYGILRVGGRIEWTDLSYEMKHPVILPKRSHVTELIIRNSIKPLNLYIKKEGLVCLRFSKCSLDLVNIGVQVISSSARYNR